MLNSARIIASLHTAEEAFDAALAAKEWENASRWKYLISDLRGELELTLRMEDPCTTLADVRYFEGFKYV